MTATKVLASLFILGYLGAVTSLAIPSPVELARVTGERVSPDDCLARLVRPTLDAIQPFTEKATALAWRVLTPVRQTLGRHLQSARIVQRWRMFAEPPRVNTALAVRLVATTPGGETVTRVVQVLPGQDEAFVKGIGYYRLGFRDKAMSNAIDAWVKMKREKPRAKDDANTDFGPDVLGLVGRYFGRRLEASLPSGSRTERIEVWQGFASMSARGDDTLPRPKPPLDTLPYDASVGKSVTNGNSGWVLRRSIGSQGR